MPDTLWTRSSDSFLVVAADRSFGSMLRRMNEELATWVVVVRTPAWDAEVYYYAFTAAEVKDIANNHPERKDWSIERAMDLHESSSSGTSREHRPTGIARGRRGPAACRMVNFDASGCITAVGVQALDLGPMRGHRRNLGPMRSGKNPSRSQNPALSNPERADSSAEIEVTVSAETKAEIQVTANEVVDYRIELTSEALPLAVSQAARARSNDQIVVSLSVENDAIEIFREREYIMDPPTSKQPRAGYFLVKGVHPGVSRLAVAFRQGGTELGVIGLTVEVVAGAARSRKVQAEVTAAPRDLTDDDKLTLIVEQRVEGGEVFYQYILHSEALGLPYRKLRSKPLLDRGNGPAATALAFVGRIYERVTKELKSLDDLKQLQREARSLGANLCQELFDPAVAKELWPLRERIKLIQIVSWEPYIPWELVRLRDPVSGDIDDHFLAEYGLVRTLSDEMPPRELSMAKWAYLGATFPMGTFPPVGGELDYFTGGSTESLRSHGITPVAIATTRDAFYDALAGGDFDILHISCHAESPHQSIERASLIIGDETAPGDSNARLVEVDTITVEAEARLKKRRPLVFLNACETGRIGAVLTAWGGWPNVFLRAGAGAFVGSAWAVRDKPAAAFSTAFYNALLNGKTLAEAAGAARASAKRLGDMSWLAFKVYGHPRARCCARSLNQSRSSATGAPET